MLPWATATAVVLVVSTVATFLTKVHLRCRWDVHASSVRWLFWFFFSLMFLWCVTRAILFVWIAAHDPQDLVNDSPTAPARTYGHLDRLSMIMILYPTEAKQAWYTLLLGAGDVLLVGVASTLFPLTYELGRLARKSMDRGVAKEQRQIRAYRTGIAVVMGIYSVFFLVVSFKFGGYGMTAFRGLQAIYIFHFVAQAHMGFQLLRIKFKGREFETFHGTFVVSPIYHRLQLIIAVYALFVFQFQITMIVLTAIRTNAGSDIGIPAHLSRLVYGCAGLALSITTSCSQTCVLSTCAPCLPEHFEAEFMHQQFTTAPTEDHRAPRENPVFVYTDIESSSALWNVNGEKMGTATELHDHILRSTLIKHRGYEVTTVGDAFQIAFHNILDAIEYCLDVQLQLLVANWPRELEGVVPATARERAGRRIIFNGLRVRMGIHDASEEEGALIHGVHAMTGKATYTGMSEVIAEYVGDLGNGGQILITNRVASWLMRHRKEISLDVYLEYLGEYPVPHVNTNVKLYQVLPAILVDRRNFFSPLRTEYVAAQRHVRLSKRKSTRQLWNAMTTPARSTATSQAESVVGDLSPMESLLSDFIDDLDDDKPHKAAHHVRSAFA